MADCEHLTTTLAYFDGALEPSREADAVAHLATCTTCQGALGDAVAIDAALSTAPAAANTAAAQTSSRQRSAARWPRIALVAAGLAAAATTLYVVWPRPHAPGQVAIALAPERAVEARFTGERFAAHRPYGVLRGDRAVEAIPLADLAKLEQRHDTADLIAALTATGNVGRAGELAATLPAGAAAESDRAAIALAANDPERALDHAYRATASDPSLAPAWWNLGLAARGKGLARVARAAFQRVADRAEPGWSEEARVQVAALDRELAADRDYAEFIDRAKAMIAGGPPISVADARRFYTFARVHVLDALRVASGPRVEALRPLARELDTISATHVMSDALERAAAADPAVRARFADRYRAVIGRTASSDDIKKLIDELKRAGAAVDDIRAGTIIAGNQAETYLEDLTALATAWNDPWIGLVAERIRIRNAYPPGDVRTIPALTTALGTCTSDAWGLRCGQLAQELASQLFVSGRTQEAETWAARAVEWFRRGVAPSYTSNARTSLGDIHRVLGRSGLARAELEEVMLATDESDCALRRYASIALADLNLGRTDWPAVRATLPEPVVPKACDSGLEMQALGTAVDLARATKTPDDIARAHAWIDAAPSFSDPNRDAIALVGTVRLARGSDAATTSKLRDWLAANPPQPDAPWPTAIRTWGFTTLIADAGARGDHAGVLELAAAERGGATRAQCTLVASLDDTELTVAARTPTGVVGDHRAIRTRDLASLAIVPASITAALASCKEIAAIARPPLHGRPDLLPAELPWWFIGDAARTTTPSGPPLAIEVTAPRPPDSSLPPLPEPGPSTAKFDRSLSGPDATPARVLAALREASYVEIHAHGIMSSEDDDAAFLALSPDPDGSFALRASTVRHTKLAHAPVVVLAACRAATVAPYLATRWSLPDALLIAGARAVVAVDVPIPDRGARHVFDELHRRIDAGEPVHAALAAIRAAAPRDSWQRRLMVFE